MAQAASVLPPARWPAALLAPDPADVDQAILGAALLPRLAVSLLAGAALGLSGALAQAALRNPLAAPSTLGVSAGAQLALALATLQAPGLLALVGRDGVALAGGGLAALLVLAAGWRARLAPAGVVLAGLAVSLWCGSLAAVLALLHAHVLVGLLVWGSGALDQLGWGASGGLAWRVAASVPPALLLARALALLELDDVAAATLGVGVLPVRLTALALSVALGTSVVSLVGVIGFVGLAAPALVRLAGGGSVRARLLWAPVMGAALLALADQVVQRLPGGLAIPTGAVTALLGAPLLVVLLRRPGSHAPPAPHHAVPFTGHPTRRLASLWTLLPVLALAAMLLGPTGPGWDPGAAMLVWRAPRVAAAAAAAGGMLGLAGMVLQRLTGNPAASPELLGVSAGAAIGLVVALMLGGGDLASRLAGGLGGAVLVLGLLLVLGWRGGFAPERLLLAGIALASSFEAGLALLLASGDPRAAALLATLSGSTYGMTAPLAVAACGMALAGLAATLGCARWLDVLPLGAAMAMALGLKLARVRLALLVLAACLTAAATVLVGPLSFAGLLAPQLARLLGLRRAATQAAGAAAAGALVMVAADWLGRTAIYPYEVPAGLLAALLGGPCLVWLLRG